MPAPSLFIARLGEGWVGKHVWWSMLAHEAHDKLSFRSSDEEDAPQISEADVSTWLNCSAMRDVRGLQLCCIACSLQDRSRIFICLAAVRKCCAVLQLR